MSSKSLDDDPLPPPYPGEPSQQPHFPEARKDPSPVPLHAVPSPVNPQAAVIYQMQQPSAPPEEDLADPRNRCLCNSMHIKTGACVAGVIECVMAGSMFFWPLQIGDGMMLHLLLA